MLNLIKSHLIKNRELILRETNHLNGFMDLLMKQRNTGLRWTKAEKGRLKVYLKRIALYIPVLFVFLLPFGMLFIPVLAEILDRRRLDRLSIYRNRGPSQGQLLPDHDEAYHRHADGVEEHGRVNEQETSRDQHDSFPKRGATE